MTKYCFTLEASEHSVLSASSADRWMTCPASVQLSKRFPDRETSIYAAEGTAAHHILSALLRGAVPLGAFEGSALVEGVEVPITQEMLRAVYDTLEWFNGERKPGDFVYVEKSLSSAIRTIDPDFGGTADILALRPAERLIWVTDFKYGAGVYVPVQNNAQLMYYALGALLSTPGDYGGVRVSIAQPRIEMDEGRFRSWDFSAFDLLNFATKIIHAAEQTRLPDAPAVPGDHCKFCKARSFCPELEKRQQALVTFDVPIVATGYDPVALAKALDDIPIVEDRIKAIREFAYQEAVRGVEIPGHKLVDKRAARKWVDPKVAAGALSNDPRLFTAPELVSPAQVEKVLGKAAFAAVVKTNAENGIDLVKQESSGLTLVSEADPRPNAKPREVEFDVIHELANPIPVTAAQSA